MMPERDKQQHEQLGELIRFPGAPESRVPARSGSDGSPQAESAEVAPQQGAAYEAEVQRRRDRRRATRSRVLRSSQAIVGRVRVVATSPTTRERARRLRRRLVDEVRLIGQGVHMVCRRCTVEGQLRRYYEGNDPNSRLRPDMIDRYDRARAELLRHREAHRTGRYVAYSAAGLGVAAEGGWIASLVGVLPSGHVALDLAMLGINAGVALKLRAEGRRLRAETAGVVEQRAATGDVQSTTADDIAAMLRDAGVLPASTTTAAEAGLALLAPPTAVAGGWEVHVALPPGVVVSKIKRRSAELASALDTIPQKVSISKIGESERRVAIRVWEELPLSGPGGTSPLVSAPQWDVTRGIPLGVDIDGERVSVDIVRALHGLMCAGTGGGKTNAARLLALAFVLDPTAELHILDGKPDGAWAVFAPHCGEYVEVQEADDLERAAVALERLVDDMRDRMARRARGEQLPFSLVILDEFQEITGRLSGAGMGADSPRARARAALDTLARRARSANMRLLLATQQFDGQTLDAGVEANLAWRWCGSVPTPDMSRAALGPRVAALGLDASRDIVPGEQVGVGYLVAPGLGTVPPLVKADLASDEDIEAVCARLLAERANPSGPAGAGPAGDEGQQGPRLVSVPGMSSDNEPDLGQLDSRQTMFVRHAADVVAEVDDEWVSSAWLYEQVAQRRGEGESADLVKTYGGRALAVCGATSERRLIDGRRVMAWRVADIRRIACQLSPHGGAGEGEVGAS